MNNIFFSEGNIGRDPVLKYVPIKGVQKPVIEMDVRFSCDRKNSATGEYEDNGGFWATVSYWGKQAEAANKILKSGMRIYVLGEKSQGEFVATKGERQGQIITTNTITASHIGLSLLGIDSVNLTPRKNKTLPAESTHTNTQADNESSDADSQEAEAEYYAQQTGI